MIPVPEPWLQAATRTHTPAWHITATRFDAGIPIGAFTVPIVGGILSRTRDAYPRTRLQIDVPAAEYPPVPAPAHLLPYGTRVTLRYSLNGGAPVTIAELHILRSVVERPDSVWQLEAVDASGIVAADTINDRRPAGILPGQTVGQAITALIKRTIGNATVTVTGAASSVTVPPDYDPPVNPWRAVEDLAAIAGASVHVDAAHPWRFVIGPPPEIGTPVDTIRPGAGGTVTRYRVHHERTWNAVAAVYTDRDTDTVVTGWWQDDRPDSQLNPNRIGHYMTLRRDFDGPMTQAGADAMAASIGWREAGFARTTEAYTVPRPWLEPGDTVTMDTLAVAGARVMVAGIRCPLDHTAMAIDLDNPNYVLGGGAELKGSPHGPA